MRKIAKITAFILFLSFCAAAPGYSAVKKKMDFFPLSVGSNWTYRLDINGTPTSSVTYRVTSKRKIGKYTAYKIESANMKGEITDIKYYAKTPDKVLIIGEEDLKAKKIKTYDKPVTYLLLPLKKGSSWSDRLTYYGSIFPLTKTVAGNELLELPAGDIYATRVGGETTVKNGRKAKVNIWYARNMGTVRMSVAVGKEFIDYRLSGCYIKPEKAKVK